MFARRRRGRCYRRLGQRRGRTSRNKTPDNNGDPNLPYGPAVQDLGPGSLPFCTGAFASALDGDKLRCTMAIGESQSGHAWSEASVNANLPQSSGVTPYTARYGFTSGSRTTSNVGYLNTATEPMIVLRGPIRVALCLRFAIWLSVCDGRRPWLPNFDRAAISRKPWGRREGARESGFHGERRSVITRPSLVNCRPDSIASSSERRKAPAKATTKRHVHHDL